MSRFMDLKVGTVLGGLMGLMGLGLVALFTWSVVTKYQELQSAKMAAAISEVDKRLFWTLQSFRYERGDTNSALRADIGASTQVVNRVATRRTEVATQMEVIRASGALGVSGWSEMLARLLRTYDEVQALRARADAELQKPLAARDTAFRSSFVPSMTRFFAALEEASLMLEKEAIRVDPTAGDYIFTKRMVWETRSTYGQYALVILGALIEKRSMTAQEERGLRRL